MLVSPQLTLLEVEVREFSRHLYSTSEVVEEVGDTVGDIKQILKIPDRIHTATTKL
jgi:hypothetical protein